jgi:Concanavalin A-like lectin/glucanases superfamily/Dickkopf N-terminal cysteine-rich region
MPSGSWPGADSGPEPPSCETVQLAACRATIGDIVTDARVGYDPAAGGEVIRELESAGKACWKSAPLYASLIAPLSGTGVVGANCTPDDSTDQSLRISSLSCKSGSSCRLYLKADGAPVGICEARTDDSCSHPFDCAKEQWCDVGSGWKPGVWGECHPLRTEGWKCSTDLECASGYCDAAGTCAAADPTRFCLSTPYESLIAADDPLLYLRLGEASGTAAKDASGNGNAGKRQGDPQPTSPGALTLDQDLATSFDGIDDGIIVPAGELPSGPLISIELWIEIPDGSVSEPILAFTDGPRLALDDEGALRADLVDIAGQSHVLVNPDKKPATLAWQHLAVTYDGFHAHLFLNGQDIASLDDAFTPKTQGELRIGFASAGSRLIGAIDEVAVFGSALGAARVKDHFRIGKKGPVRTFPIYSWFQ